MTPPGNARALHRINVYVSRKDAESQRKNGDWLGCYYRELVESAPPRLVGESPRKPDLDTRACPRCYSSCNRLNLNTETFYKRETTNYAMLIM
jgi:hypothetical protein